MQDRRRQFDEIFLQRTAGPYIWVTNGSAVMFCSIAKSSSWPLLEHHEIFPKSFDFGKTLR